MQILLQPGKMVILLNPDVWIGQDAPDSGFLFRVDRARNCVFPGGERFFREDLSELVALYLPQRTDYTHD